MSQLARNTLFLSLFVLLLLGTAVRILNLFGLHNGDEDLIIAGAIRIRFFSQMDPKFYSYNGLTMYLPRMFAQLLAWFTGQAAWLTSSQKMTEAGRILSAGFSVATLFLIYKTGTLLKSKSAGIMAMALAIAIPLATLSAHFATADNYLLFFFSFIIFFCIKYTQAPTIKAVVLCALASGLAIGVKQTGFLFSIIPLACFLFQKQKRQEKAVDILLYFAITIICALTTMPYLITSFTAVRKEVAEVADYVSGARKAGWTAQFEDTGMETILRNMLYGFGPSFFFGSFCAIVYSLFAGWRRKKILLVLLPLWCLFYLLFHATMYIKYPRYLLALVVPLSLLLGYLLDDLWRRSKWLGAVCIAFILFTTILYGMLYATSTFLLPHPQITASLWIYKHIPPGSRLLMEDWNSKLPLSIGDQAPATYHITSFDVLAKPDTQKKADQYRQMAQSADYIILATQRIKQIVQEQRKHYLFSAKFYDDLDRGKLGYKAAETFTAYPSLFGWELADLYGMDQTATSFDHRKVVIYKKM